MHRKTNALTLYHDAKPLTVVRMIRSLYVESGCGLWNRMTSEI